MNWINQRQWEDWALLVCGILIVLGFMYTIKPQPCTATLDVYKGKNFNQPMLTSHNCSKGEIPINLK